MFNHYLIVRGAGQMGREEKMAEDCWEDEDSFEGERGRSGETGQV